MPMTWESFGARTVGRRGRVRLRRVSARIVARWLTSYVACEASEGDHGLNGLGNFRGVVVGIRRVHAPRQPANVRSTGNGGRTPLSVARLSRPSAQRGDSRRAR